MGAPNSPLRASHDSSLISDKHAQQQRESGIAGLQSPEAQAAGNAMDVSLYSEIVPPIDRKRKLGASKTTPISIE